MSDEYIPSEKPTCPIDPDHRVIWKVIYFQGFWLCRDCLEEVKILQEKVLEEELKGQDKTKEHIVPE